MAGGLELRKGSAVVTDDTVQVVAGCRLVALVALLGHSRGPNESIRVGQGG